MLTILTDLNHDAWETGREVTTVTLVTPTPMTSSVSLTSQREEVQILPSQMNRSHQPDHWDRPNGRDLNPRRRNRLTDRTEKPSDRKLSFDHQPKIGERHFSLAPRIFSKASIGRTENGRILSHLTLSTLWVGVSIEVALALLIQLSWVQISESARSPSNLCCSIESCVIVLYHPPRNLTETSIKWAKFLKQIH